MADAEFDIERAMENVHPASKRKPVERALVFLPDDMRADVRAPAKPERPVPTPQPRLPDWDWLKRREASAPYAEWKRLKKQATALVRSGITSVSRVAAALETSERVAREVLKEVDFPLDPLPVARTQRNGCSLCGSTTVMCRDDGSPYAHKCRHRYWCRTVRGHVGCEECERSLIFAAETRAENGSEAKRRFAENIQAAEAAAPQVAWEFVEVVRAVSCKMCGEFLQGRRAVKMYAWDADGRRWRASCLQCQAHPRPGVPLADVDGRGVGRPDDRPRPMARVWQSERGEWTTYDIVDEISGGVLWGTTVRADAGEHAHGQARRLQDESLVSYRGLRGGGCQDWED